jgi:hypothetical protein
MRVEARRERNEHALFDETFGKAWRVGTPRGQVARAVHATGLKWGVGRLGHDGMISPEKNIQYIAMCAKEYV